MPTITSLTPFSMAAGGPALTLTVSGSSFAPGAAVRWNGSPRPTTVVDATRLTAQIAAADIAAAGTASVTVVNPGGATSNAQTFTIAGAGQGLTVQNITFQQQRLSDNALVPLQTAYTLDGKTYPCVGNAVDPPLPCTFDGNRVVITATVGNSGQAPQSATVTFYDGTDPLPGASSVVTLAPNGTRAVAYDAWDTNGRAWDDDGRPHAAPRTIRAVVTSGPTRIAEAARAVKVLPKPLILVHGWRDSAGLWDAYPAFLKTLHPDWLTHPIRGMNTSTTTTNTIAKNAEVMWGEVEGTRIALNAWHVDVVAHSMGGLVSRQYIQDYLLTSRAQEGDQRPIRPIVGRLIMLGTPNLGSTCAELLLAGQYEFLGQFGRVNPSLQTPLPATFQLTTTFIMGFFNRWVYKTRDVPFFAVAGNHFNQPWCMQSAPGDGVVPTVSAVYGVPAANVVRIDSCHTPNVFPGSHCDGLTSPYTFRTSVLPRLALGPTRALAAAQSDATDDPPPLRTLADPPAQQVTSGAAPQLAAGGSVDIPLPVPSCDAFGVTFSAPVTVGATLIDPAGNAADGDPAGGDRAAQPFRSFRTANPGPGTWTLRLHNQGDAPATVPLTMWVEGSPLTLTVTAGVPGADGRVQVSATLANGGSGVGGGTLKAVLLGTDGAAVTLALTDLGGGSYAGTTGALASATYLIVVDAASPVGTRIATGGVDVAAASPTTPSYALTATASPGGTVTPAPAPGPYAPGTAVTLTAAAAVGHTFVGWTVDGVGAGSANPLPLTMDADHAVTATFAPGSGPAPTLTLVPTGGGVGTVAPAGPYALNQRVTLAATPDQGQIFLGWRIVGSSLGHAGHGPVASWANPLTLTLQGDTTATPVFAPRPAFPDVTPQTTGATEPIAQLAARGVIKGRADGTFDPVAPTLRVEMAALIVRTMGWTGESATNPFADRDGADDELWNAVAILAAHGVAKGYAPTEYGTSGQVLNAQVVSFITRAMVAKGYWQFQPDDHAVYPNVAADSGHRVDLATYAHYAGAVRGTASPTADFGGWDQPASRAWFAFVLWQALDSTFGR